MKSKIMQKMYNILKENYGDKYKYLKIKITIAKTKNDGFIENNKIEKDIEYYKNIEYYTNLFWKN